MEILIFLLVVTLLICLFFAIFCVSIPAYTGIVIGLWGKEWKSRGPGLFVRIPGIMTIEKILSLQQHAVNFNAEFVNKSEESILFTVAIEYHPMVEHLINYSRFKEEQIRVGIQERIKSILVSIIRSKESRDEIYDNLYEITKETKEKFEHYITEDGTKLQEYYGLNIKTIMISKPELPEAIMKAAIEREAMEKINFTRDLEMKKIKEMARDLVKAAEEKKQELNFDTALEYILINLGKIKKENKQFGISKDTLSVLENLLPAIVREFKGQGQVSLPLQIENLKNDIEREIMEKISKEKVSDIDKKEIERIVSEISEKTFTEVAKKIIEEKIDAKEAEKIAKEIANKTLEEYVFSRKLI